MNYTSSKDGSDFHKAKIIEIVGPAGAGKTTLYQALGCYKDRIRSENFPDVRKLADAPFFIGNGIQLIPHLLSIYHPKSRQLTRREFAWMSILHGWSALLCHESKNGDRVTLLDQGPIYLLAEVRLFGPEYLRQNSANELWRDLYKRWGATLDMVVLLDAPNDILLERIRSRSQEHIVKDQPATVVYEFLDRYRAEYEFVLSILTAQNASLKVLRIDTGRQGPLDIVDQFLSQVICYREET